MPNNSNSGGPWGGGGDNRGETEVIHLRRYLPGLSTTDRVFDPAGCAEEDQVPGDGCFHGTAGCVLQEGGDGEELGRR